MAVFLKIFNRPQNWLGNNLIWLLPVLVILTVGVNEVYRHILMLVALFGLYFVIRHPRTAIEDDSLRRFGILLGCFLIPMLVSLFDSGTLGRSLEAFSRFLSYFLVAVVFLKLTWKTGHERVLLYGVFCVATFWCLDGLVQFFAGTDLVGKELYANERLTGTFEGPRLGFVLAILAPIYFEAVRLLAARYKAAWLLIVPFVAVVLLGGSRSSWILLFVAVVGYFIYMVRLKNGAIPWRRVLLPLIIVVLASGVLIEKVDWLHSRVTSFSDLFSGDYEEANEATSLRLPLWSAALRITAEHPINGVGLRGYGTAYFEMEGDGPRPIFKGSNGHPHLFILETSSELGVIGLAGYALFLFLLVKACVTRPVAYVTPWAISALVAAFPLSSTMSFYSSFMSSILWTLVIVWIVLERRVAGMPDSKQV